MSKDDLSLDSLTSNASVELPKFWSHEPEKWFLFAEAQFRLRHISVSSTKFEHVISALGADVISRIPSSILSLKPNDADPYGTLKSDLFKVFNNKPAQRISTFLDLAADELPIGELYAQSKSLLEGIDDVVGYLIKDKLLRSFPEHFRPTLATQLDEPVDRFYEQALNVSFATSVASLIEVEPYSYTLYRRYRNRYFKSMDVGDPTKCQGPPMELRERRSKTLRMDYRAFGRTTSPLKRLSPTTAYVPSSSSSLFYVTDVISKREFLIDSGASKSLIPRRLIPSLDQAAPDPISTLVNVSGDSITTFGTLSRRFDIGLQAIFEWKFVAADVITPILGADFLRHYDLSVDVNNKLLFERSPDLVLWLLSQDWPPEFARIRQNSPPHLKNRQIFA